MEWLGLTSRVLLCHTIFPDLEWTKKTTATGTMYCCVQFRSSHLPCKVYLYMYTYIVSERLMFVFGCIDVFHAMEFASRKCDTAACWPCSCLPYRFAAFIWSILPCITDITNGLRCGFCIIFVIVVAAGVECRCCMIVTLSNCCNHVVAYSHVSCM